MSQKIAGIDLTTVSMETLEGMRSYLPMGVASEIDRRKRAERVWNDPVRLKSKLRAAMLARSRRPYTDTEDAMGLPDAEADEWESWRRRIRELTGDENFGRHHDPSAD